MLEGILKLSNTILIAKKDSDATQIPIPPPSIALGVNSFILDSSPHITTKAIAPRIHPSAIAIIRL
jgi:hypothetical protein